MTEQRIELRHGAWQDVLADVEQVDALIFDAPYSSRTHQGFNRMRTWDHERLAIQYAWIDADDVDAFMQAWSTRCAGWLVSMTDDELSIRWKHAAESSGRYAFPRVVWIDTHRNVRMGGDGPASAAIDICASRPKARRFQSWGSLPGYYFGPGQTKRSLVRGAKPLWLMRALVRDYSKPGDLVCDPFSGSGTTARACQLEGRRFIGAEVNRETYEAALERISQPFTASMFVDQPEYKTPDLFDQ